MCWIFAVKREIICPAKINLHLQVGERYRDADSGCYFHRICTLMQAVYLRRLGRGELGTASAHNSMNSKELCMGDRLDLEFSGAWVSQAAEVKILLDVKPAAPCALEQNLIYRAAKNYLQYLHARQRLVERWPARWQFCLEKHIPQQAGLGGGSSDAAAALKLLNSMLPQYCDCRALPLNELRRLGAALGSDVAFFLQDFDDFASSLAWAIGRGEKILAVSASLAIRLRQVQRERQLCLLKPRQLDCETAVMYRQLNRRIARPLAGPRIWEHELLAMPQFNLEELGRRLDNDFFAAMRQLGTQDHRFQLLATLPQYLYSPRCFLGCFKW